MLTFSLDTSTPSPSVALVRDGRLCAELWVAGETGSGRRVLEAAHGLVRAAGAQIADVDRIVVGIGPGGFTGLRIGIATALGLGQALAVPVHGVVSLEALALALIAAAPDHDVVVPVVDARRRELFAAAYQHDRRGGLHQVIGPCAIAPVDLAARIRAVTGDALVGGPGVSAAGDAFDAAPFAIAPEESAAHRLRAALLVERATAGATHPARPLYARLPDAEMHRRVAVGSVD